MRVSCYILISQYERCEDGRCETPVQMRFTSAVGCGTLFGTVVIAFGEDGPDIFTDDLRTNLPLDDDFCSDLMIAAYAGCGNTDLLELGDIHCPLPDLSAEMERWYKPLAAQQKMQQIAHALRLACGGVHPPDDDDPPWHLEVRNITDRERPERPMTFLRVHYQPLGLEIASVVAAANGIPASPSRSSTTTCCCPHRSCASSC